ncbi:MAG: hypothetical protein ABI193_19535, partial [Minicystis sp.]
CCSGARSEGLCSGASCQGKGAACSASAARCQDLSCEQGSCQAPPTCSGAASCNHWWTKGNASAADGLITCLCTYCQSVCGDLSECRVLWQTSAMLSVDCQTCSDDDLFHIRNRRSRACRRRRGR